MQQFLGFTGYYRYFIEGYSAIARPLLDLTKQVTPWHWEELQQQAFDTLRAQMCTKPVLQQLDFKKVFYLQTDASAYGIGAVLSQEGGTPISNSPNLKPYDIYEREFLGVVKVLEHWRLYLIWTEQPFIIETDHKNLTYWKSPKKLMGRMACWHEKLQDYNFKILHIPRKTNTPADVLS